MTELDVDAYCALIRERSRLQEKAYKLGYWLNDNTDHPQFEKREQVWINTTNKYAHACDQIKEMEDAYDAREHLVTGDDAPKQ